jgi:ribonuclease T1
MLRKLARSASGTLKQFCGLRSTAQRTGRTGFAALLLLATFAASGMSAALARSPASSAPSVSAGATLTVSDLPPEGRRTYGLIHSGGPFPYEKDGVVFGNRERLLPMQTRGYYREYTVVTPQAHDRGARRIICGGAPRTPERCYYTADHYASFREIVQ